MILSIFDSFCKTVLRNKARDMTRERHVTDRNHPLSLDEIEDTGSVDQYPSDEQKIVIDDLVFCIEDEGLYQSLLRLPKRELFCLLLHFWEGWKDELLASRFSVTTRTVRYWRNHSLGRLREMLMEKGWRPSGRSGHRERTGNDSSGNSRKEGSR